VLCSRRRYDFEEPYNKSEVANSNTLAFESEASLCWNGSTTNNLQTGYSDAHTWVQMFSVTLAPIFYWTHLHVIIQCCHLPSSYQIDTGVKLTTHFHLVPRLRMHLHSSMRLHDMVLWLCTGHFFMAWFLFVHRDNHTFLPYQMLLEWSKRG